MKVKKIQGIKEQIMFIDENDNLFLFKNNICKKFNIQNVQEIYGNEVSYFIKTKDKLYSFGFNLNNELGEEKGINFELKDVDIDFINSIEEIKDILICNQASFLLTKSGEVYVRGKNKFDIFGRDLPSSIITFTKINIKNVKKILVSQFKNKLFLLKNDGKITVFESGGMPTDLSVEGIKDVCLFPNDDLGVIKDNSLILRIDDDNNLITFFNKENMLNDYKKVIMFDDIFGILYNNGEFKFYKNNKNIIEDLENNLSGIEDIPYLRYRYLNFIFNSELLFLNKSGNMFKYVDIFNDKKKVNIEIPDYVEYSMKKFNELEGIDISRGLR